MTFLVLVARSGPSHLRVASCSTPSGCAPNMHLQNVAKLPLSYLGPLSRPTCPDGCGPADAIAAKVCRPLGLAKPCCTPPVCQNKPHLTVILRIVFFSFLFCFFGVELAPRIATSVKEVKSPWLSWLLRSSLSDHPPPPVYDLPQPLPALPDLSAASATVTARHIRLGSTPAAANNGSWRLTCIPKHALYCCRTAYTQ
jgi:hypothetical protein